MRQEQQYLKPGAGQEIKPYSIGTISTPTSPHNINFSYSFNASAPKQNPEHVPTNIK